MIELGTYFHRETLVVVTLTTIHTRYWEPGNVPLKVSGYLAGITRRVWIEEPYDDFAREWVRNEPLSLDVLKRLGWCTASSPAILPLDEKEGEFFELRWDEEMGLRMVVDSVYEHFIQNSGTLRGILLAMKACGVTPAQELLAA